MYNQPMAEEVRNESELERELLARWQEERNLGYQAGRFYQMFMPHCKHYVGGVEAVRRVISKGRTGGAVFVVEKGRPDLLLEHVVLDPKWSHLFDAETLAKARENLTRIPT